MNKPKSYTLPELFSSALMGFTFEFYSSKDTNFIVENLSKLTMKNVVVTNTNTYPPKYSQSILLKEYDGEKPRYSFKLAQQRYESVLPIIKNILNWITETAECKRDNLMRVNLSFDHEHLQTLESISKMNPQKLILKLDEEHIYNKFPNQKDSPYCISINQLLPITEAVYSLDLVKNTNYIIGVPKKNYYGVNFVDHTRGVLEFNYIGGEDYAENESRILELLEYYIIKTFQSLNEVGFNKQEIFKLEELTEQFYKIQEAYYEPEKFSKLFPDINLSIDIKNEPQILKSFWPKIRSHLFEVVVNNKFTKGDFNYDTEYGAYQLRKAELNCSTLKNYDLVLCNISGITENCNIISCKVNNARMYNTRVVKNNEIKNSYLQKISAEKGNLIETCVVENNREMINCDIKFR